MSYINAPATRLLATHCAICGRPLVDALSVECGIGPVCRENAGFDYDANDEERHEVNQAVYIVAKWRSDCPDVAIEAIPKALERIRERGYFKLAAILEKNIATITVVAIRDESEVLVYSPYNQYANSEWYKVAGARWDGKLKARIMPIESLPDAYDLCVRFWPNTIAKGLNGLVVLR